MNAWRLLQGRRLQDRSGDWGLRQNACESSRSSMCRAVNALQEVTNICCEKIESGRPRIDSDTEAILMEILGTKSLYGDTYCLYNTVSRDRRHV
jgi:hypothetical protein